MKQLWCVLGKRASPISILALTVRLVVLEQEMRQHARVQEHDEEGDVEEQWQ